MRISLTNRLLGTTPVVSSGAGTGDASAITDPDHSNVYVSGSNSTMTIDFGQQLNLTYVGISGHNLGDSVSGDGSIELKDGSTTILTANFDRNKIVMFNFALRSFTNLRLVLTANGGTTKGVGVFVAYVAAGINFEVPNGGQVAGFQSAQLTRPEKTRVSSSASASPTAITRKKMPIPVTLSLPNMAAQWVGTTFQDFLEFSATQPFFINEKDATFATAILCFEPVYTPPSAHDSTRALQNVSIKFKAFNGL